MRGLLMDIGGVILRTEDPEPRRIWERRLQLPEGGLSNAVFGNDAARNATIGLADEEEVWKEAGRLLGLSPTDLRAMRQDFFAGDRWDTRLIAFARSLRPAYRTGILSNAWTGARANFQSVINDGAFDVIVYSCEIGAAKPAPEAFREAVERMQCPAGDVVFVDDFERNAEGARAAGLLGVLFRSADEVLAELTKYFPTG